MEALPQTGRTVPPTSAEKMSTTTPIPTDQLATAKTNAIHTLLTSVKVGDLVTESARARSNAPQHPICFDSELTVQEGCQALASHRISSAPIYSPEAGGFVGMLDYKDLVAYVLEVFHKVPKDPPPIDVDMEVTDIVKRATMDRQGVPVKLVSNLSHRNPLVAVYSDAPLLDAVEEFVRARVHRIVVLERPQPGATEPSKFLGVLSQSSVVGLVAKKFGRLGSDRVEGVSWENGAKSLAELGLVRGDVITVSSYDTVLEALYIMYENSISSVAILDRASGSPRLAGSISMTDIKEILSTRGGWRRLYEPCFRFFVSLRSMQGLEAGGSDRVPSFSVHPSTPLIVAIEKMAATHTHRVWIVDQDETADPTRVPLAELASEHSEDLLSTQKSDLSKGDVKLPQWEEDAGDGQNAESQQPADGEGVDGIDLRWEEGSFRSSSSSSPPPSWSRGKPPAFAKAAWDETGNSTDSRRGDLNVDRESEWTVEEVERSRCLPGNGLVQIGRFTIFANSFAVKESVETYSAVDDHAVNVASE
ncbi:cell separation during budding [Dinochytrium kinnereticum]|nr:cell separation during budding [Dinochytrium kinnereticum]